LKQDKEVAKASLPQNGEAIRRVSHQTTTQLVVDIQFKKTINSSMKTNN